MGAAKDVDGTTSRRNQMDNDARAEPYHAGSDQGQDRPQQMIVIGSRRVTVCRSLHDTAIQASLTSY